MLSPIPQLPDPDPESLSAAVDGAMSVVQACEFTGDSRPRLIQLMEEGVLEWFYVGAHRRITRQSLVRYLAAMLALHKAEQTKRPGPKPSRKPQAFSHT